MNITVNKKKQEMRDDPLVDFLVDAQAWVKKYSVTLVGVAVAVAFLALIYGGYLWIQNRSIASAQDAFGKAISAYAANDEARAVELLTIVADNHKNTPHAAYSAYLLGTLFLNQGKYDESIQWLKVAEGRRRGTGFVNGSSCEALSAAYEAKGDLQSAREYAEKALKDPKLSFRHAALRWKLALINRELNQADQALSYCRQLVGDTLAIEYRQKAANLISELQGQGKS